METKTTTSNWSTIRVPMPTKMLLIRLCGDLMASQGAVVEIALERLQREMLLQASNAAYERMLADPEMAAAWREEIGVWDDLPDDALEGA